MQKFIVEGGVNLSGSITPSGNKNEALPVLAAALLANKPVIIHNVPEILDISIMKELLTGLGAVIKKSGKHSYIIDPSSIKSLVNKTLKEKIAYEAQNLNMLREKTAKLPI